MKITLTPVEPIGTRIVGTLHGHVVIATHPPRRGPSIIGAMKAEGLTAGAAAEALGITVAQLFRWERGGYTLDGKWTDVIKAL